MHWFSAFIGSSLQLFIDGIADDIHTALYAKRFTVKTEIVIQRISPFSAREISVKVSTVFVCPCDEPLCFLVGYAVAVHDIFDAVFLRCNDAYTKHIGKLAQYIASFLPAPQLQKARPNCTYL